MILKAKNTATAFAIVVLPVPGVPVIKIFASLMLNEFLSKWVYENSFHSKLIGAKMNETTILRNKCDGQAKLIERLQASIKQKNDEIFDLSSTIEMDNVETKYAIKQAYFY